MVKGERNESLRKKERGGGRGREGVKKTRIVVVVRQRLDHPTAAERCITQYTPDENCGLAMQQLRGSALCCCAR